MTDAEKPARTLIAAASRPALARHIKMRRDPARDCWVLLGPERVLYPDAIAVAILELCDANRSVEAIAEELARTYNASKERILGDVVPLLQGLADKGVATA
jgi:pyrroloquinoline quinone biosynthesis protein D